MIIGPLISTSLPLKMNGKQACIASFLNFQLYIQSSSESEMYLVFIFITSSLVEERSMIRYPLHELTARVFFVLESFCIVKYLKNLMMLAALNLDP